MDEEGWREKHQTLTRLILEGEKGDGRRMRNERVESEAKARGGEK